MRCDVRRYTADAIFNFTLQCRSPALINNHYSEYQLFLYQTIAEHREQGLTFDAISEWLNKEGHLTAGGKQFKGAHVHSILKKKLAKEELLDREYPPVWSDLNMEVLDKTILMSDFGFPNRKK
tara:strand:- start:756 stop:1124 length:369 start_codon:yes stop_codon:yes gene_type:complete